MKHIDAKALLYWAEENLVSIYCKTNSIADTGDYGSVWIAEDYDKRKSYGDSIVKAIQDAMMDDEDPRRMDYVPPEFR